MRAVADLDAAETDEASLGPMVAKIDDETITMGELDREIEKLPPQVRAQFQDPSKKREFLEQYVMTRLLYDMGQRKNYDR